MVKNSRIFCHQCRYIYNTCMHLILFLLSVHFSTNTFPWNNMAVFRQNFVYSWWRLIPNCSSLDIRNSIQMYINLKLHTKCILWDITECYFSWWMVSGKLWMDGATFGVMTINILRLLYLITCSNICCFVLFFSRIHTVSILHVHVCSHM